MVSDWGYLSLCAMCVRLAKRFFVCFILKIYRAHSACVFTLVQYSLWMYTFFFFFLTINITGNRSLVGEFMLPGNDGTIIFVDIIIIYKHTAHVHICERIHSFCCWFYCSLSLFFHSSNWCQSIINSFETNVTMNITMQRKCTFSEGKCKRKRKICQCSFALPDCKYEQERGRER